MKGKHIGQKKLYLERKKIINKKLCPERLLGRLRPTLKSSLYLSPQRRWRVRLCSNWVHERERVRLDKDVRCYWLWLGRVIELNWTTAVWFKRMNENGELPRRHRKNVQQGTSVNEKKKGRGRWVMSW